MTLFVPFITLFKKETHRFLRIWPQTLLPPVITMTLYFIVFGKLLGSRMPLMGGMPYLQYIAPGLVMMTVINNAYANTSSSFFGAKFSKSIEELLVSPIGANAFILGFTLSSMLRSMLAGFIVFGIAELFESLPIYHPILAVFITFLSAMIFAQCGLINGMLAKKFDDISFIPTFILTPLTYLGGIFFSVDILPEPWHTIAHWNPVFNIVNSFRFSILGMSDIHPLPGLLALIALAVILHLFIRHLLIMGHGLRS
jgi:ABC-2 type transport system permease protein